MKKRKVLEKNLGNKIRFIYSKIDSFSLEKNNKLYNNKLLFMPTLLLTDLYALFDNGQKVCIDHVWIDINETLLDLKLAIDDTISFTARPLIYEKKDITGKVILDIGINNIFNVKVLSRSKYREKSFDVFLTKHVKNNEFLIPNTLLNYYENNIPKELKNKYEN